MNKLYRGFERECPFCGSGFLDTSPLNEPAEAYREGSKKRNASSNLHGAIKFLVERNGSIADVYALNQQGYDLGKAAEKVVRTGPKWQPGVYKGKIVRSYHTQPITFVIQRIISTGRFATPWKMQLSV